MSLIIDKLDIFILMTEKLLYSQGIFYGWADW